VEIIEIAVKQGKSTLSEYDSKKVLAAYNIPVTKEKLVNDSKELSNALEQVGYPLVLKGCSEEIAHKTEKGLIRVDIRNKEEAFKAFDEIISRMNGAKGAVLVQEMVKGQRELLVGLTRDPQFGPCVMFGLGGIFTEVLKDVSFRVAPLSKDDAIEMMQEIKGSKILSAIRGMDAVDMDIMAEILINIGRIGLENEKIKEIDINPLIISGNKPIAVDALIVLDI